MRAIGQVNTTGFDVNPLGIEWLKSRDAWRSPYDFPVDSITCWDSLEHIAEPHKLLCSVNNFVFISIPIFRDSMHALTSKHYKPREHYWYFTHNGLIETMNGEGFALIHSTNEESVIGREDIHSYCFQRVRV
jgi:hypothetical protein